MGCGEERRMIIVPLQVSIYAPAEIWTVINGDVQDNNLTLSSGQMIINQSYSTKSTPGPGRPLPTVSGNE